MKVFTGYKESSSTLRKPVVIGVVTVIISLLIGFYTARFGEIVPIVFIGLCISAGMVSYLYNKPILGLYMVICYTFALPLTRELGIRIQWGLVTEVILLFTWGAALFSNSTKARWFNCKNDLTALTLVWLGISILQIANGGSITGWLYEIRSTALVFVLVIPLTSALFHDRKALDVFLKIVILWSILATINGLKQLYIGLFPGEAAFLNANAKTHLIYGKLRVFSFLTDAGQFGATQAYGSLICFLLALAPLKIWKRVALVTLGCMMFYGMMISGTRGAFFVLAGVLPALFLTKNFKLLSLGLVCVFLLFAFLKFTNIGQGNYQIRRLRTAVNPSNDASYQVRLISQERLKHYLSSRPFGGGIGTIGGNGKDFNPSHFLASVEPDSYWVKVWAMYGIVGLTIWFCIMTYVMGKCCGIIWNIRDPILKIKLIALIAGAIGVFLASYGNEVINRTPISIIVLMSFALIYLAPQWDAERKD